MKTQKEQQSKDSFPPILTRYYFVKKSTPVLKKVTIPFETLVNQEIDSLSKPKMLKFKEYVPNQPKVNPHSNSFLLNLEKWTKEEDETLVEEVKRLGKQWSLIVEKFEGKRTSPSCAKRYEHLKKHNKI